MSRRAVTPAPLSAEEMLGLMHFERSLEDRAVLRAQQVGTALRYRCRRGVVTLSAETARDIAAMLRTLAWRSQELAP